MRLKCAPESVVLLNDMPDRETVRLPTSMRAITILFLEEARKDTETAVINIKAEQWPVVVRMGHMLKGSGASYGMPELSRLGALLETSAKRCDTRVCLQIAAELVSYLDRVDCVFEG